MEDIIIDDKNKMSVNVENINKDKKKIRYRTTGKKRSFFKYVADLLEKTIIISTLIIIDFILFAKAGSYSLFSSSANLQPELIYILGGILIVSFLLIYVVSFSKFLQNLLLALTLFVFILAMFNQFAMFDKSSILAGFVADYAGNDLGALFNENSHLVIAGFSALIFLIFLEISSRITIAYFCGILLIILGGIVSDAWINKENNSFKTLTNRHNVDDSENGKNFVYIAMPNLTSVTHLIDFETTQPGSEGYNAKLHRAHDTMLGFYSKNNFMIYPNAYINEVNPFMNMVDTLNPGRGSKDIKDTTLNNVLLSSYWNFEDIYNQYLYLKDNKMYDTFRKAKYDIKAYESRGIELCHQNNEAVASRCIKKQNIPVNIDFAKNKTLTKIELLLAQWIDSTGLTDSYSLLYNALRPFVDAENLPLTGYTTKNFYVVDSLKTIDILKNDIKNDKGNNAYFAFIDLPSDLFIYDENCQIKPVEKWVAKDNLPWVYQNNKIQKREAYMEQVTCLYSKLEQFMQSLKENNVQDRTVVILQGISGVGGLGDARNTDFLTQFQDTKQVNLAIRDPLKDKVEIYYQICAAPSIIKNYLYKKGKCEEFENINLINQSREMMQKELKSNLLSDDKLNSAANNFDIWYKTWAEHNKENSVLPLNSTTQSAPKASQAEKSKVAEKVLDQEAEREIKSFSDAVIKEEKQDDLSLPLIEKKIAPKPQPPLPLVEETLPIEKSHQPPLVEENKDEAQAPLVEQDEIIELQPQLPLIEEKPAQEVENAQEIESTAETDENQKIELAPIIKVDVVRVGENSSPEEPAEVKPTPKKDQPKPSKKIVNDSPKAKGIPEEVKAQLRALKKSQDVIPPFALDD